MGLNYANEIDGRSVIDSTGRAIGEVVGLVLEPTSWHVEALQVKLNHAVTEEIGAPHGTLRAARMDVPTEFIRDVSDNVVLSGPIDKLQTLERKSPK
jgi:sporulation protein YlmC with PRC-barrel domain